MNNNITYVSDFVSASKERDENRLKIAELKRNDDKINLIISSFESKVMKYVYEALELAHKRIGCNEKVLYALAHYDRTGIFKFFYQLSQTFDDCSFNKVEKILSPDELLFKYGVDNVVFLPVKMFDGDDLTNVNALADQIVEICKYTFSGFKKEVENIKFNR